MEDKEIFQNKLRLIYLVGFSLILFLPLLNIPPWFSPPAWGKAIVFRIVLSILIFLFIYQLLSKKGKFSAVQRIVPRGPAAFPFWLLIALFAIYLLATIFSLDPRFSFWNSPYRSGGSLNFLLFIIFAVLAFIVFGQRGWKKIWFSTFLAGILVCAVAFIQKFEIFKKVFVASGWQPYSTLGGPTFLALYLLLLSFLPLSFGLSLKNKKSLFYFFCSGLFILTMIIVAGRASLLGLAAGFLFFAFFYPVKAYSKKLVLLRILILTIFAGAIFGVYWLNNQPKLRQSLEESKILSTVVKRIFPAEGEFSFRKVIVENARFSTWKIGWSALKERPILGYGPENFAIAFDKNYDPSLPDFGNEGADWWDRAHNFIFDIGVTVGIPGLIIYLLLFGALFWQLQKLKNFQRKSAIIGENQNLIIYHGIQATFIGHLVANLFSFDVFSTYLILFLIIGYSFHLIYSNSTRTVLVEKQNQNQKRRNFGFFYRYRKIIISALFACLIWFIWSANLKPLKINKELNWAEYYSNTKRCQKSFENMEEVLANRSIIDSYVRLKYVNIMGACIIKDEIPQGKATLSQKTVELLKEAVELMPYYTRSWLLLGNYTNYLINKFQPIQPALANQLKKEAYSYLEKAYQLKPKSQMILQELIKADLSLGRYQKAKEEAQECINIKPSTEDCWWLMGLVNIYLGEDSKAIENMEKAVNLGFSPDSEAKLLPLMEAYGAVKNYQKLIEVYKKLLTFNNLPQYHASLATCYKEVGDYENARKEAIKVVQLLPETEAEVEEFLRTLR